MILGEGNRRIHYSGGRLLECHLRLPDDRKCQMLVDYSGYPVLQLLISLDTRLSNNHVSTVQFHFSTLSSYRCSLACVHVPHVPDPLLLTLNTSLHSTPSFSEMSKFTITCTSFCCLDIQHPHICMVSIPCNLTSPNTQPSNSSTLYYIIEHTHQHH